MVLLMLVASSQSTQRKIVLLCNTNRLSTVDLSHSRNDMRPATAAL